MQQDLADFASFRAKTDSIFPSQTPAVPVDTRRGRNHVANTADNRADLEPFITVAVALALALRASGIAAAQSHGHDGHGEAASGIMLNDGAGWRGDQNVITGMPAIHGTMAASLDAIHDSTLPADAARKIAAEIPHQRDFMIENSVIYPGMDEQFPVVLGEVMGGVSAVEAGEMKTGAAMIVQAMNAYGEHFEHRGRQSFD